MFMIIICIIILQILFQISCVELAVHMWNCQHLMSCILDCSRFMEIHMPRICCHYCFITRKHGINYNLIGLCTSGQKLYLTTGKFTCFQNLLCR